MSKINNIILNGVSYSLGGSGSGLTEDMKEALLQLVSKVAYIDEDGQDYYDDLETALYPPADLVSISAVYTQSETVYDSGSLDDLKADLVVTAHFSDSSSSVVSRYMLSGSLTAGTSTITVSYGGESTTFDVTVTHDDSADWDYIWKYTDGLPPASDWDFVTSGGSGYIREIHDDGLFLRSPSGITTRYGKVYAESEIIAGGGGVSETEFYISSDYAASSLDDVRFFEVFLASSADYGLRVIFAHKKNNNNKLEVKLMDVSSPLIDGTVIGTFAYDTMYKVRLEVNGTTEKGAVYLNGVLLQDNVDLTAIYYGSDVGFSTQSSGNATIQSYKIKYSPAEE